MFYIVLREQIYMEIFQVIRLLKIKILGIYIIFFIISSKRSFFYANAHWQLYERESGMTNFITRNLLEIFSSSFFQCF